MKRYRLKAVSLLLAAGLTASLIGCGKGNGETGKGTAKEADMAMSGQENASETTQEGAQKRIPKELAGNYYTGEYETLLETATVDKPAVSDGAVYYARWYPSGTKVFQYDMETKQTTEIPLNLGEREGIQGLCINEDGELVAVKSYFEEADEGKIYYWILVFSEDGTVLWEKEVTELVQEETEIIDFPNAYVYGLALGKEGRICFCAMRTIWVLDREGNLEFSIRSDEHIYDIAALEESREENVEMMDHEYGRDVLWQLLYYNMAQFFDLDAGVCDFDNDDFKGVLEFAGRFPISNPYHDDDPSPLLLANEGELLLLPMELDEIRIYQAYCQIFNADISCVGYPGNYACGSVAKGGDMTIVMSEKSQNKEGAWEFIRSFLEKDYQHRYTTCLPMLRSAYDRKAAEAMWIDYETGEKQTSGSSIGFGGPEFNTVVYDVTEGVTEEVKKLIEK